MRFRILGLVIGLSFLLQAPLATAAANTDPAALEDSLEKLTAQTQALQKQIQELKAELRQVKMQQKQGNVKPQPAATAQAKVHSPAEPVITSRVEPVHHASKVGPAPTSNETTKVSVPAQSPRTIDPVGATLVASDQPVAGTSAKRGYWQEFRDRYFAMGPTVTTSPYLGLRSAYDASDLIVNFSTMNEDLLFLREKQEIQEQLGERVPSLNRPVVQLGGKVESQILYQNPYSGEPVSDINLSSAELDTLAEVSPWALGFLSLQFDDSSLSSNLVGSGDLTNNSRVFLRRGFLTIGNLNKSPVYFSAGQMYVPFGTYSSMILSNPDTLVLGRTLERAMLLGLYKDGFYASGYGFNGATNVDDDNTVNGYGLNAGYEFGNDKWSADFGAGYMNDIANSEGMQNNGADVGSFQGFDASTSTEILVHHVPAVNAHAQFGYGSFKILGEYIAAVRSFSPSDMTFNNGGARPKALYIEGDYAFDVFSKPSNLALAYSQSWQSLALLMPKNSYIVAFSTSIWKNTIESLEFRHDANYPVTDSAGGRCDAEGVVFCPVDSTGGQQNTVIAQIGVYF